MNFDRRPVTPTADRSRLDAALAAASLPARSIIARAVGAVAPAAVIGGAVTSGIARTGSNSLPLVFVLTAAVFALFSVGYLAAVRRFLPVDASGAFYTIVGHALGRVVGAGAGWLAVAAYAAMPVCLYGLIGSSVSPFLSDLFTVSVPWQPIALGAALLIGWLGLIGTEASTRVLMVLVAAEIATIIVVSVANWAHAAPVGDVFASLNPRLFAASMAVISAQFALGLLSFIGTELTVTHTQDSRDGHRGVARATYATIGLLALIYILAISGMSATLGADGVVVAARTDASGMFFSTAQANLGNVAATITRVVFATSLLAGAIAFHCATSRYCFFLGRDRTAPAFLGRPHPRYGSPFIASLAQTTLALIAIAVVSAVDADPQVVLFYIGGAAGAVGILILLALTALATAVMLLRRTPSYPRRTGIAATAVISALLLGTLTGFVLVKLDTLLGVPAASAVPDVLRLTYLGIVLVGGLWHWLQRRRRTSDRRNSTRATEYS
ncbi:APC family permease [Amycolatopsis lurida]